MPSVSKSLWAVAAIGVAVAGISGLSGADATPEVARRTTQEIRDVTRYSPLEIQIRKALEGETRVNAPNNTLADALQQLADASGVNIVVDETTAGEQMKSRVSVTLSGMSLRSALKIVLDCAEQPKLGYDVTNEVITVSGAAAVEQRHVVRTYDVTPLLRDGVTSADVANLVTEFAIPSAGPKAMPLGNQLVVSHNRHVHEKVLEMLNRLCPETVEAK